MHWEEDRRREFRASAMGREDRRSGRVGSDRVHGKIEWKEWEEWEEWKNGKIFVGRVEGWEEL